MKKCFLLLLALFASTSAFSQSFESFLRDSLDVYVSREMKRWDVPGLSVCVVKDGKVIVEKGYGVTELGGNAKVDENTLFMIGSNSKAMTATQLAYLAYQGKCSMNDRLQIHLPAFTMRDTWVASHVTLTDILCHRMGMETFQGDFTWWGSNLSDEESIRKFGRLTPVYDFRTTWGYTNMGYVLAGECIRKLSGQDWYTNTQKVIFDPLGMKRSLTRIDTSATLPSNIALPHTMVERKLVRIPIEPIDNLAPAASVWSSAEDMSHWVMMQLDSGMYQGRRVIPMEVIEATRTPYSIEGRSLDPVRETHYSLYGLGWGLEDMHGREVVSHTGGVNGFVSSVTLVPEENLGIVVLTNTDANGFFSNLKYQLLDVYFGNPYLNVSARSFGRNEEFENMRYEGINAMRDTVARGVTSDIPLKAFTGSYTNEVYGSITLAENNGSLIMRFSNHPHMTATLGRLGRHRFLTTYSDPTFGIVVTTFNIVGKKVKGLELRCADFVEFTPYMFVKH